MKGGALDALLDELRRGEEVELPALLDELRRAEKVELPALLREIGLTEGGTQ